MKKHFTLLLAATMLMAGVASADVLTPEQALARLNTGASKAPAMSAPAQLKLQRTILTESNEPAAYFFLKADSRGYVLLSADDQAEAVLGYSDNPVTADTPMPPQLKGQMEFYAAEIEALRTGKVRAAAPAQVATADASERQPIAPLVTTRWGQEAPYNDKTPTIDGNATVTGCGATALAQVMNYYKYPARGIGEGTCTIGPEQTPETISLEEDIDWANMADTYPGTDAQNEAVATLMKLCGYAAGMSYNVELSESAVSDILLAVVDNFDYDKSANMRQMANYTLSDWEQMLYDNLREYGPIVYFGYSVAQGGHIFVCDGYARDNYFHFNWGWSGEFDGYFKVSALNPYVSQTGIEDGGFTSDACAVFGMKPSTGEPFTPIPELTMDNAMNVDIQDYQLNIHVDAINATYTEISVQAGLRIKSTKDGNEQYVVPNIYRKDALPLWDGWDKFVFDLSGVEYEQGVLYDIELVSRYADGSGEWLSVRKIFGDMGYSISHDGTRWHAHKNADHFPHMTIVDIPDKFYNGAKNLVTIEVSNPFSDRVYAYVTPYIDVKDDSSYAAGDGLMIDLQPGETVRKDVYVEANLTFDATKEYSLSFKGNNKLYDDTAINMVESPGSATVSALSGIIFNDGTSNVVDPTGFDVALNLSCTEGYYDSSVRFQFYSLESDGEYHARYGVNTAPLCIEGGEVRLSSAHVSLPEAAYSGVTKMYAAAFELYGPSQIASITEFTLQQSGVAQAVAEGGALKISYDKSAARMTLTSGYGGITVQACSVDGKCVVLPVENGDNGLTADASLLPAGVYIVLATDASGARATAKIMK